MKTFTVSLFLKCGPLPLGRRFLFVSCSFLLRPLNSSVLMGGFPSVAHGSCVIGWESRECSSLPPCCFRCEQTADGFKQGVKRCLLQTESFLSFADEEADEHAALGCVTLKSV